MAYGQFVDYEPHPAIPGAYNFQTANGQALTFGGPEAETLKSRLDAYGAAHMVAGPGGGDTEPAAMAPAAPPTPQPAGPTDTPYRVGDVNTGLIKGPDGRLYKTVAGSPGISKEQLQQKDENSVAMRTGETETVRGAKPVNEQYLAERDKLNEAEHAGMQQEANADAQAYQAGQQAQHQNLAMQTGMMDAQQQQVQAIQAQVAQAQSTRDKALADYSSSKVDPSRIFSGGVGVLKGIGAALAAGAGAWGATIGHTRNFAQEIIDSAVNRDIAAQEAEIRIKKDTADNALSDLMRRGMSLDQAKNTLMTIQNQWMQRNMADAATKSGDERIAGKWQQQVAERDKQNIDYEQAYRDKAAGEATSSVSKRFAAPQAATAGGRVALTPDEAAAFAGKQAGTESTNAGTAKTEQEVTSAREKEAPSGQPKLTDTEIKAVAELDAAMAGVTRQRDLDKQHGHPYILTTGALGTKPSQELAAGANAIGPGVARATEGDAATKDSMERAVGGLTATTSAQREATYEQYLKQLETKKRAIIEGATKRK